MYSAVLMLALTAGSEAVDHGRRCQDYGCCAPACSAYVGCTSGCTSACHSCRGGLFARRHERNCHCAPACCAPVCSAPVVIYGCSGCVGSPVVVPEKKKEMPKIEKIEGPKKTGAINAPATIIVSLPADARLTVDGAGTTSTTDRRVLVTPVLEGESTYVYTMQAEITRDGLALTQTQQVTVRGGQVANVQFNFASQNVASR